MKDIWDTIYNASVPKEQEKAGSVEKFCECCEEIYQVNDNVQYCPKCHAELLDK